MKKGKDAANKLYKSGIIRRELFLKSQEELDALAAAQARFGSTRAYVMRCLKKDKFLLAD